MKNEKDNKPVIEIEDSDKSFSYWIEQEFVPNELRPQLRAANVLIVPEEQIQDIQGPVFAQGTEQLWRKLKDMDSSDLKSEICIGDEYEEYAFHGILLIISGFVVTNLVAPVVAMFVYDQIRARLKGKDEESEVRFAMTITLPDGTNKKIKYRGPAREFSRFIDTVNQIAASPKLTPPPCPSGKIA